MLLPRVPTILLLVVLGAPTGNFKIFVNYSRGAIGYSRARPLKRPRTPPLPRTLPMRLLGARWLGSVRDNDCKLWEWQPDSARDCKRSKREDMGELPGGRSDSPLMRENSCTQGGIVC